MATPHRHGRLLSKRPAAYVDRLVCAATATLVPRRHGLHDLGVRARPGLDALSPATPAHSLLLHRHAVSSGNYSHGELHLSELSRPHAGISPARRRLCALHSAATLEDLGHRCSTNPTSRVRSVGSRYHRACSMASLRVALH